jgi:peptide deformylase
MLIVRKDQTKLVESNSPVLFKRPEDYDFTNDGDPTALVNVLFDRMKELGGIGLSANQVGVDRRIFVMGIETPIAVINPEILECTTKEESFREGCLTFPGLFLYVTRPVSIRVKFQTVKGDVVETEMTGITARVFQHEYDHMEGKLFTERVSKMKLDLAKKRYANLKKKIVRKHAVKTMIEALNESIKSERV